MQLTRATISASPVWEVDMGVVYPIEAVKTQNVIAHFRFAAFVYIWYFGSSDWRRFNMFLRIIENVKQNVSRQVAK